MKKIFAVLLTTLLLAYSLVLVFAAPSPTTSAVIGGITIDTETEEIVIDKDDADAYLDITHVHEAEEGSDLYNIGEQLKKDDKLNDTTLDDVLGDEFKDSKLIQLFTIDKTGNIDGDEIIVGDVVLLDDGSYKIENSKVVVDKDGKVVVKLDCPSVNDDTDIRLVQYVNGQWVQAEHVRVYNGYITFDFDLGVDLGSVWAVTVDKTPVSPATGDTFNSAVYFAVFAIAVIGTAVITRKYLAHK